MHNDIHTFIYNFIHINLCIIYVFNIKSQNYIGLPSTDKFCGTF